MVVKPLISLPGDEFVTAVRQWKFLNTIDDKILKEIEIAYIPENFFGPDWWRYSAYLILTDGRVCSAAVDGSVQEMPGFSYRNIISFACGYDFLLALSSNGAIYAQEADQFSSRVDPAVVDLLPALCSIKQIACGVRHSIAVTSKGEVYRWGTHDKNFSKSWRKETFKLGAIREHNCVPIKKVACGLKYTMAVSMEGDLFAWGDNTSFQLGIGETGGLLKNPCRLELPITVTDVACGWRHTICLSSQGTMYSWGDNAEGQLGHGDETDRINPTEIEHSIGRVVEIAAITIGSGCRTEEGDVYVWGRTRYNKPTRTSCSSIHEAFAKQGSGYMHKPLERQHLPALPPKFGSQSNLNLTEQDSVRIRVNQPSNLRVQSMNLEQKLEPNVMEKKRKKSSSLTKIDQRSQEAEPKAFEQLVQDLARLSVSLGAEIEGGVAAEENVFEEKGTKGQHSNKCLQSNQTVKHQHELKHGKTTERKISKESVIWKNTLCSRTNDPKPSVAPKPVGIYRSMSSSKVERNNEKKVSISRSISTTTSTSLKVGFKKASSLPEQTSAPLTKEYASKKLSKELLKTFEK